MNKYRDDLTDVAVKIKPLTGTSYDTIINLIPCKASILNSTSCILYCKSVDDINYLVKTLARGVVATSEGFLFYVLWDTSIV